LRNDFQAQDRVTAQGEEVFSDTHLITLEHLAPNLRQSRFFSAGWQLQHRLVHRTGLCTDL
jgi:hypothetical protein